MIEFVVVGTDAHAERVIDAVARSQSHRVAGVASFDAARVGSRFMQHEVMSIETVRELLKSMGRYPHKVDGFDDVDGPDDDAA